MRFHIITLFPGAFDSYLGESILRRAIEDRKIKVRFYNPRDYTEDKHKRIDRAPYGGGPGMIIQAEPVIKALDAALNNVKRKGYSVRSGKRLIRNRVPPNARIIWLEPSGKQFDTAYAKSAAKKLTDLIFICGRYEGIDARVKKAFKVEDVSVGPFVLTGGELPTMIMIDCISRQLPGVLGDIDSLEETRVASPDVYTRPAEIKYKGKTFKVPNVLLSGHHKKIEAWRSGRLSK